MKSTEAISKKNTSVSFMTSVLLAILLMLCWLVCTVAQVEKYLSLPRAAMVCGAGCCGVVLVLLRLKHIYRTGRDIGRWSLVVLFCVLSLSFAVLYPKSKHHAPGKGSDREDALRVELYAVTHHQYPYAGRTYLGHPPTPLPGSMLLAAPFYFAGSIALQNLLWFGLFLVCLTRYFRTRATVLSFAVLFLLTALENLNDFEVGGDYMTNILYVAIAIFVFWRAIERKDIDSRTWIAVLFLGIALSSRILYAVTLPPLMALALQRTRPKRALLLMSGVLLTAALVTVPVFTPHFVQHFLEQLNQNADKLTLLPAHLSSILPILALAVAACGFFLRMTLQRVYLLTGIASLIMILPPMLLFVAREGGLARPLTTDLEYLAASAIFLALWVLAQWEQLGRAPAKLKA